MPQHNHFRLFTIKQRSIRTLDFEQEKLKMQVWTSDIQERANCGDGAHGVNESGQQAKNKMCEIKEERHQSSDTTQILI